MVIYHAQVYSIANTAIVECLGSGPPSWVGSVRAGVRVLVLNGTVVLVLNGNSYS